MSCALVFTTVGLQAQDEDRDPTTAPTRYLLVEEYARPPANKLAILSQAGAQRHTLPVVQRQGRPDYDVDIQLNKSAGTYYRINEQFSLRLVPERDCYILLYDIQPDGLLNILFPNPAYPSGRVQANQSYEIPSPQQPRIGVQRPLGLEFLQAIASAEPLDISAAGASPASSQLFSYTVTVDSLIFVNDLRRQLSSRSVDSWAGKEVFFIVSENYSDPTPEEVEIYRSTGSTGTRAVVPIERWNFQEYLIVWGDTLWGISERFYGRGSLFPKIAYDNGIVNPDRIYAGDTIRIYQLTEQDR